MKVSAIIAAGGNASRLGKQEGKQLLELAGHPVIYYSIKTLRPLVDEMILVIRPEDVETASLLFPPSKNSDTPHDRPLVDKIIPGGATRTESVRNALNAVSADSELVLIHDGARPFVTETLIRDCLTAAHRHGAAVAAVPVHDTIKQVSTDGFVQHTPNRAELRAAQTPQVFRSDWLKQAYASLAPESSFTDDASLVEALGYKVNIVEGDYRNLKITTEEDLCWAQEYLQCHNAK